MSVFVVGYDLKRPGQNYSSLITALKSYSKWCHPLDSTWFIVSNAAPAAIRDHLATHIDNNDALYVGAVDAPAAWRGFSTEVNQWLKDQLEATV